MRELRHWTYCTLLGMALLGACEDKNTGPGNSGPGNNDSEAPDVPQEKTPWLDAAKAAWKEGHYKQGADLVQQGAQQGDLAAMEAWAELLLNGAPEIPRRETEGVTWLHKAAQAGSAKALAALGDCADRGIGMQRDPEQAVQYYQQSAAAGNAHAQVMLGLAYRSGYGGLPQDQERSYRYLCQAAEKGNAEASYHLAECYDAGLGVKADPALALSHAQRAAERGHARACLFMSKALLSSYAGTGRDEGKAATYCRKAADAGIAEAQCLLAKLYAGGNGVPKDLTQAAHYFEQAAARGDAEALCCLAICYDTGAGVSTQPARAAELWQQAAAKGHAASLYYLGCCAEAGRGVQQDPAAACKLYANAAARGHADAMVAYGRCLINGIGTERQEQAGLDWWKRAAAAGHAQAAQLVAAAESPEAADVAVAVEEPSPAETDAEAPAEKTADAGGRKNAPARQKSAASSKGKARR